MVKYILTISFFCVFVKGTKKLMGENLKNIAMWKTQRAFLFCDLYDHLNFMVFQCCLSVIGMQKDCFFFSCESLPCVLGSLLYKYIIHLYIKYEYRWKRNVLISINIFIFKCACFIFLMKLSHCHICIWISYFFTFVIVLVNNLCWMLVRCQLPYQCCCMFTWQWLFDLATIDVPTL